jgi:hypothetical protein
MFSSSSAAPDADALSMSLPAFDQSGGFPIKRSSVYPAGLQIEFVDDDLHQGCSRDSEKHSE